MVGILGSVVPLAKGTCRVPAPRKTIAESYFIQVESLLPLGNTEGTTPGMITPCQELRPCRSTNGAYVKPRANSSFFGQSIHVWCYKIRITLKAKIPPTLIVGDENDDVGRIAIPSFGLGIEIAGIKIAIDLLASRVRSVNAHPVNADHRREENVEEVGLHGIADGIADGFCVNFGGHFGEYNGLVPQYFVA